MIEMKQFSKRMVLNSTLMQIIAEDRRDLLLVVQVKEGRIVFIAAIHIPICIIICYLLKTTSKKVFFFCLKVNIVSVSFIPWLYINCVTVLCLYPHTRCHSFLTPHTGLVALYLFIYYLFRETQ